MIVELQLERQTAAVCVCAHACVQSLSTSCLHAGPVIGGVIGGVVAVVTIGALVAVLILVLVFRQKSVPGRITN